MGYESSAAGAREIIPLFTKPSGTIETFKEGQAITLQDNVTLYSSLDIQKAVTIDKDSKITATSASTSNIHPASMIIGQDFDNKTYEPKLDICGTVSAVNMPAVQGNEASKTNLVALDVTGNEVKKNAQRTRWSLCAFNDNG